MHLASNSNYCVGIVEAWEEQGYLYICSELCEKGNLNDYLCQTLGTESKEKIRQRTSNMSLFCMSEGDVEEGKNDNV